MSLLRDRRTEFEAEGVHVAGISRDSPWTHIAWAQTLDLDFTLFSDWNAEAVRGFDIAHSDMKQAAAAASYLREVRMNGDAERALWTGLVITYARPYNGRNKVGPVGGRMGKPDDPALRPLHRNICARRDDLAAHNDKT